MEYYHHGYFFNIEIINAWSEIQNVYIKPSCDFATIHICTNVLQYVLVLLIRPSIAKSIVNSFQFSIVMVIFLWSFIVIENFNLFQFKNILYVFVLSTVIMCIIDSLCSLGPRCCQYLSCYLSFNFQDVIFLLYTLLFAIK